MTKEQLIQDVADSFEQLIAMANQVAQRDGTRQESAWGPREIIAHLAGWEIIATVRIPHIVAGMQPLEFADEAQQTVMDEAINTTVVTIIGDQPLSTICDILRQAYQRDIALLKTLDETFFQPGEYVYERTKGVIEHCLEHMQSLFQTQDI